MTPTEGRVALAWEYAPTSRTSPVPVDAPGKPEPEPWRPVWEPNDVTNCHDCGRYTQTALIPGQIARHSRGYQLHVCQSCWCARELDSYPDHDKAITCERSAGR